MLNLALGTTVEHRGRQWVRTHAGLSGHALYGPYEELAPGRYAVEFLIAPGGGEPPAPDAVCAVIDVIADGGQTDVTFDYVLGSQLSDERPIVLEFDLADPRVVEYRVHVHGVPLLIADLPQRSPRAGDAPAFERVPRASPELIANRATIRAMHEAGVRVDVKDGLITMPIDQFGAFTGNAMRAAADRRLLAQRVIEAVGYKGDGQNSLYRAFVGTERPLASSPEAVPFSSTLCQQAHFGLDQYRYWTRALKEAPTFVRKQWEFVYIAQALFERGYLEPGRRGLVFGAGQEQLPALFASFGVSVLATDQAPETAVQGGWIASGQHTYDLAALNQRQICTDAMFRQLVSFAPVDMNAIPAELDGQFDFCWSACAFEHLGSIEHGLAFVENSMRTLKPGGLAIHTTEFNLTSDTDTIETDNLSIFRRRDIDALADRLAAKGYEMAPMDWEQGEGFAEMVIDLPPFLGRGEPHIRLRAGEFDVTSIGVIVRKPD